MSGSQSRVGVRPLALLGLVLGGSLHAQAPEPTRPDGAPAPRVGAAAMVAAVGLHMDGDRLVGGGPRYAAEFAADGAVTYTPAFGAVAARTTPVRLRLASVRRGAACWSAAAPQRSYAGLTAQYSRPGFRERYEVRPDGVEQSFVFDRLPDGAGDLVVTLDVETELVAAVDGEPLRFELAGVGAVQIGAVTGIDADGHRAAGAVSYRRGELELRLPAAFVDGAAMPLVLDPLIGTVLNVATSALNYQNPDVAYDLTNDMYLVVWEYVISGADRDVRAQRIDANGVRFGSTLFLATGTDGDALPQVASSNAQDVFVVVWQRLQTPSTSSYVRGRAVSPTGSLGAAVDLARSNHNYIRPDISASRSSNSRVNTMLLVWENATADHIRVNRVFVNSLGLSADTPLTGVTIKSAGPNESLSSPAVARSDGTTDRRLVVWGNTDTVSNRSRIEGAVLHQTLVYQTPFFISHSNTYDNEDPDVDGNGWDWTVTWERSEDTLGASNFDDVVCRGVRYDPNAAIGARGYASSSIRVLAGDPSRDEENPAIAWFERSSLVVFQERIGTGSWQARARSVDPHTCLPCEPGTFDVASGATDERDLAIASQYAGGTDFGNEALIAIESADPGTGAGDIQARRFTAEDGQTVPLAGACGTSVGHSAATCARTGNANFTFTLIGSLPSSPVWLVLSMERADLSCGTCTLVPDPFSGWVFTTTTSTRGTVGVTVPIPGSPALRGLGLYSQWVVNDPVSPGCFALQSNFSSTLSITIE